MFWYNITDTGQYFKYSNTWLVDFINDNNITYLIFQFVIYILFY